MARITLRQLLDHAAEYNYGVPAFNINNMEQGLAIMEAAEATRSPVIIQASRGARAATFRDKNVDLGVVPTPAVLDAVTGDVRNETHVFKRPGERCQHRLRRPDVDYRIDIIGGAGRRDAAFGAVEVYQLASD